MSSFDGQDSACGGGGELQTYYRIVASFSHINSTGAAISIDISNGASGGGSCKWGFK